MVISRLILALLCTSCLSATENTSPKFQLKKHTETPDPDDHKKFDDWILSQHPSSGKKALLSSTITSTYYPFSPTITWYKAHIASSDFETLLNQAVQSSSVIISTQKGNYDYKPDGAFWVDFANGQHFGGGFRDTGNVQEERMFDEFPSLANLAYVLRNKKTILPATAHGTAEPFLIVSLLRKFDVSNVPYGRDLDSTSPKKVEHDVIRLHKPFSSANIIGLAAIDYNKDHKGANHSSKYSMKDLKYHLQAALLGDLAALQYNGQTNLLIHTGRWGAGAFKNSLKMVTALQILAAEIAFSGRTGITTPPHLFFHGIDNSLVAPIQQEITQRLNAGTTPSAILKIFYERQDHDSSWRPQNS